MKAAIEVFLHIAERGAVWDGDLIGKDGRDRLVKSKLVWPLWWVQCSYSTWGRYGNPL